MKGDNADLVPVLLRDWLDATYAERERLLLEAIVREMREAMRLGELPFRRLP